MAKNTKPKNVQHTLAVPESPPGCGHPRTFAGSRITQLSDLDTELAALADMTLNQMRIRWQEVSHKQVPRVRRALLRLALAYELQAAMHGGLSRRTELRLAYLAGKNGGLASHDPGPTINLKARSRQQAVSDLSCDPCVRDLQLLHISPAFLTYANCASWWLGQV